MRRWRDSSRNWPAGGSTTKIRSPIIRSVSYYHWCALLCGFSEAALEQGLLSTLQLDAIRRDLEASLPGLRACRQLLVVIPASLEEQPRIVDLLGDEETLGRLRRVHEAFGEALREERMSREIDSLDH